MKMKDDVKKVFEEYIPDFYIEYVKEKRPVSYTHLTLPTILRV